MTNQCLDIALLRGAVVDALDEAAVLRDLIALVFWAAETIPGVRATPLSRGALLAQDRLDLLVAQLEIARAHLQSARPEGG